MVGNNGYLRKVGRGGAGVVDPLRPEDTGTVGRRLDGDKFTLRKLKLHEPLRRYCRYDVNHADES